MRTDAGGSPTTRVWNGGDKHPPKPTPGVARGAHADLGRRDVHWKLVCGELGLDGLTPHELRRTFGSLAWLAGSDLTHIQKAMGHSSITVTAEIYAQLFDSQLARSAVLWTPSLRASKRSCLSEICPQGPILTRIRPCDRGRKPPLTCGDAVEPPIGIEPMTYSLRVNRSSRLS